ncbi:Protein GNRR-3 [Aphelenchoides avenae]|nr:Protein GNRR-3 [Aphelenchus avenae]
MTNGSDWQASDEGLTMVNSTSELVEMFYQMLFFFIGAPLNAYALARSTRSSQRMNGSEIRLIRLSRQLLIAHLMVLCIYCVWRTYWFMNIIWVQGDVLCKLYSFLSALPFHLWSNLVAAVAIDMLYCISAPLKSVQNGNVRVSWLIGISWAFAILCSLPMTWFKGTVKIPGTHYDQCYPLVDLYSEKVLVGFNLFHVFTTFYVPLLIILTCYSLIGCSLHHQMVQRRNLSDENVRRVQNNNTQMRFLKATIAIISTFVLTWLPYQVMALLRVLCEPDSPCQQVVSEFNWLQAILLASTCINPFLYKFGTFRRCHNGVSGGSFLESCRGLQSTNIQKSSSGRLLIPNRRPIAGRTNSGTKSCVVPLIGVVNSTSYPNKVTDSPVLLAPRDAAIIANGTLSSRRNSYSAPPS